MVKISSLLGINARNYVYSGRFNSRKAKSKAVSKLASKKALIRVEVAVPKLYAVFRNTAKIESFDWESLPSSFAVKPNRGLGGEGIIVLKKRAHDSQNPKKLSKNAWITTQRKRVGVDDLKLHVQDIIEGAYSMGNVADSAFIEEYVGRHKRFKKYSYRGTPDIRIIVFNKVPVMAMLRLPTKESGGRANLHQGAIAVGVDIATGITTKAFWHGMYIKRKPGSKKKLNGIKIPNWTSILETAVRCQIGTGIGYLGADIVLHPEKGPMVLELNCQPGLGIQLANESGLKKRLEKVEDMEVRDAEHGVKIAKALFASSFSGKVRPEEGLKIINVINEVVIKGVDKRKRKYFAKIDTGAWRTSISQKVAEELGLLAPENILWEKKVRSSLGQDIRPVINLTFRLGGRKISTPAFVAKRMSLKYPIIIGRKNLKGFLIEPVIES